MKTPPSSRSLCRHRKLEASRRAYPSLALAALLAMAGAGYAQTTGFNKTAAGPWDYNDPANWVGGTINGIWDPLLVLSAGQTVTFAADTVLSGGLNFGYDGANNLTLRATGGDHALTLGGDITVSTVNSSRTVTIGSTTAGQNLNVNLGGATRSFTVGSGRTLLFNNVISNGGIITNGGSITFAGANTYAGATNINSGTLNLSGAAGSAASSDFFLSANGSNVSTLAFLSTTNGNTGTTRVKNLTARGAGNSSGVLLTASGNATANSVDSIANTFSAASGNVFVTVTPNAARNARLEAASFTRSAGSTVLFRGSDLGVSTVASQTAGDANILFGAVSLVGAGGAPGLSTVSIIRGAYGDITTSGTGSGLVTHDSTFGVRLLNTATEYTAAIADGQSQLDNVRYVRATGDASQDLTLAAPTTTINSLSFRITGAGTASGVTISGDPGTTLKLNSGMIYASQAVTTAASTDAMIVTVPTLDLNGGEGMFLAFTAGLNQGNTPAPLQINSSITNDGGNGVTIGGTGEVIFGGSTAQGYTGVTTLNSGILKLGKTLANSSIPGDLVLNGGSLIKNTNAIPDTASVTINGGTFYFDTTFSSGNNNHTETFTNLTVNGGSLANHGSNASFTLLGNLTMNASSLGMNQGGDVIVQGTTTLNGGGLTARESSSTTTSNGLTTLNNVVINAPASGSYTAITLTAHGTNKGALLTLNGDVVFNGNATNANSVLIDTSAVALANQGVIALNGLRTFTVGDGAAAIDLSIVPAMTDSGSTQGGFSKAGAGTMALTGASTFTGPMTIDSGSLLLSGTLSATTLNINAGALELAAADRLPDGANLIMNGGTFKTGGFSETLGIFDLRGTASIDLGAGATILNFADSSFDAWSGALSIASWTGSLSGGGTDQIFFGNSATGLTADQLALITFVDPAGLPSGSYGAAQLFSGEIVAVPEPSVGMLLSGLGGLLCLRRRRKA